MVTNLCRQRVQLVQRAACFIFVVFDFLCCFAYFALGGCLLLLNLLVCAEATPALAINTANSNINLPALFINTLISLPVKSYQRTVPPSALIIDEPVASW